MGVTMEFTFPNQDYQPPEQWKEQTRLEDS